MCQERNTRQTKVGDRIIKVDRCIQQLIDFINITKKRKTVACCCGHGKYDMSIVVDYGKHFIEILSGIPIPRTRRFYVKDKQGYYYIPEALEK